MAKAQVFEAQNAGSSAMAAAARPGQTHAADCASRCGHAATSSGEALHHQHNHRREAHGHEESGNRGDRGDCVDCDRRDDRVDDDRHGGAEEGCPVAPWETELRRNGDVEYTTNLSHWLRERADVAESWKWKHVSMRDALESSGAVHAVRFYLSPSRKELHCTWCFSQVMVGHPEVVHGGATAFAFDETFGVLFAMLGVGHGFTANISVNYRKPLPAALTACMHVALDRVEGRKYFLCGSIRSDPSENAEIFSEASALFIIPRPPSSV
ncbi:hypothetical protein CLOM_g11000 [Closterium sp. NIES-68]|nr:hypothetical protein CLOM_g11000 [Closterium sp. NIES-68]